MKRRLALILLFVCTAILLINGPWSASYAQDDSTPPASIFAEAINPDANVRNAPTIEADRLGAIQPGQQYPIHGRRFEWMLIAYDPSPNGWAWVHSSVVTITGDINTLPEIDPASLPPTRATPTAISTTASPAAVTQTSLPTFTPLPQTPTLALTPTPFTLADLETGRLEDPGAELARRVAAIETAYLGQPVTLIYDGTPIRLDPATVGFTVDQIALWETVSAGLDEDFRIVGVPLVASYNPDMLLAFLQEIAAHHDTPPMPAFDNTQLTFRDGEPGRRLDIEAAQPLIAAALFNPDPASRSVDLPLIPTNEASATLAGLEEGLVTYFNSRGIPYRGPNMAWSVYVVDLETGAAAGVNANVLHSAASTAKIGVIASYFRSIYQPPAADMRFRLAAAVICSSNSDANQIMAAAGNGDPLAGIRYVSDTFCRARATNTLIDHPFWIGTAGEAGVPANYYDSASSATCPDANPDTAVSTVIDTGAYTTAADMGLMLDGIYQCAARGAGLAATFPGEITQDECTQMIELLRGTHFQQLTELGIPAGVDMAHKVGYGGDAVGDAGIVFSPGGDYALVIYLWDPALDNDTYELSQWFIFGEISRLVYNYFNRDAPLLALNTPSNARYGGAACVLPRDPVQIDLNNIEAGRFDTGGIPLGTACYDWPNCRPFDNWGG